MWLVTLQLVLMLLMLTLAADSGQDRTSLAAVATANELASLATVKWWITLFIYYLLR